MRDAVEAILVFLLIMALVALAVCWIESTKCERQWSESGVKSRWIVLSGCQVKTADNRWIPATAYKEDRP